VVEVTRLGLWVVVLLMADGSREEVGGSRGPTMVAVRLTAEARRRGSAAGRPELDPWWAVAPGGLDP
jgi:hypothetical protein